MSSPIALLWILLITIICGILVHTGRSLSLSCSQELPSRKQQQKTKTVVVVGSGVGGLAVAARIASASASTDCSSSSPSWSSSPIQVTILEKNSFIGGRCGSFDVVVDTSNKGTFRHERGPSLLLLQQVYRNLFQDCSGQDSDDYGLQITQCIPAYQVVFDDGDTIELGFPSSSRPHIQRAHDMSRTKMDTFEPNGSSKWDEYMKMTAAFLDCGLPNFIEQRLDLSSFPAFLREALKDGGKRSWPLKAHSDVLDVVFTSDKMRTLASFQNLYVGLEPYVNNEYLFGGVLRKTAPAVFGLLAAIELHPSNKNAGVFAPIGGIRAVQSAFQRLAEEKGVQIRVNSTVTKIDADGVHVRNENGNDSFVPADLVICNADLPYATETILSDDDEDAISSGYDWDDSFDYSSGVIAFHWSIDKPLHDLNTHNVFLVACNRSMAEASWRVLRPLKKGGSTVVTDDDDDCDDDVEPFNFYVHRAGKTDATAAPSGCDALLVLVPCRTLVRNEDYARLPREEAIELYKKQFGKSVVSRVKDAVLARLSVLDSLNDLEDHILNEVVDTPGTYADYYNVAAGTPFAVSHGLRQLSFMRPGAESSGMSNVLFVGAGSRPGNGVPLVLMGAKQVAEKALRRLESS